MCGGIQTVKQKDSREGKDLSGQGEFQREPDLISTGEHIANLPASTVSTSGGQPFILVSLAFRTINTLRIRKPCRKELLGKNGRGV